MNSPYKSMWVMVAFDLPTLTKKQRQIANNFRKNLISSGFTKLQLSVYVYYCQTKEKAIRISEDLKFNVPDNGHITIFFITDKQFGMIKNYYGRNTVEIKQPTLFDSLE
jgi:CRISPR-associated protein Cas2